MAETENLETPAGPAGTRDSALRPAGSDLHPADPADDLTGNTPSDGAGTPPAEDAGWPAEDADDGEALAAELPDAPWPGDSVPGDGTVDPGHQAPQEDALRAAEYGRESEEAAAITSDSAPRPTETPVE